MLDRGSWGLLRTLRATNLEIVLGGDFLYVVGELGSREGYRTLFSGATTRRTYLCATPDVWSVRESKPEMLKFKEPKAMVFLNIMTQILNSRMQGQGSEAEEGSPWWGECGSRTWWKLRPAGVIHL